MRSYFNTPTEKDDKKHHVLIALLTIVGLLFTGIGLLVNKLPDWATYSIVGLFLIIALYILINPFSRIWKFINKKSKEMLIAYKYCPRLKDTIKDFKSRVDAQELMAFLNVITDWSEFKLPPEVINSYGLSNPSIFNKEGISLHIETIKKCIEQIDNNFAKANDFKFVSNLFGSLVYQYNRLFIQVYHQIDIFVGKGKVSNDRLRNLKKMWNLNRENHISFTNQWENLAKEINAKYGYSAYQDYYEKLSAIE